MTEPEKEPVETPVDASKEQKPQPKGYQHASPSFTDAADGLGWYLLIDGVADLIGAVFD